MGPGPLFTNIFPLVFPSQMSQPSHLDKSERAKRRPEMESFSARLTLTALALLATLVSGETQELATHPVMGPLCQRVGLKRGGEM